MITRPSTISARMAEETKEKVRLAARLEGVTVSRFAAEAVDQAAREVLSGAGRVKAADERTAR